jgi:hypothetical protein
MDDHAFFLAALLALMAVVGGGRHSAQIDQFLLKLTSEQQGTVQPVCSDVELSVGCVPLSDIPYIDASR